ncbi:MAG TPA: aminomethyl-transferring glycine dehydrogenase subunit GcvPB [Thermodesulfobacteriota bacterium]|nr:aminomethyl-transferring glycine dehydrogenase subunit GcvPB [Thermodesulfobacteriota bacterium]
MAIDLPGVGDFGFDEGTIFERSAPGREGASLPALDVPEADPAARIPAALLREPAAGVEGLPEVSEVDVVRHFTRLSQWNFAIDLGLYPLGSCTMKYNPKLNEEAARLPGFATLHPYLPEELVQGALELMWRLERALAEITGMAAVTLQPAAGAHGELAGVMMIRAYHEAQGRPRRKVLIPDSAHGTNPASSAIAGYEVVPLRSGPRGVVEPEAVAAAMDDDVAALMLTNPNTLGLFEEHILEIAELVHGKGGLLYLDGANLNALMGIAKPGDMGVDVIQLNLHKTFSTPHGGGGPGAGPVGVSAPLVPFLPVPVVVKDGERFRLDTDRPRSIGRVRAYYGNFLTLVRAYAYICTMGGEGLAEASRTAILHANYLRARLRDLYDLPFDRPCMHEVVFTDKWQKSRYGVTTLDIAKRLIDYGFHPPTIYFPLVVAGALMIEPTETESKASLDGFVEAMRRIAEEAAREPETVKRAPHTARLRRLNETRAAREPRLTALPRKAG